MSRDGIDVTLVAWLKLGEFLLCSVELISESGRDTEPTALTTEPAALTGEPLGVLLMRSGDTCHGTD
jgi:hypothetical protein